jgi:hypothetical protein
LPNKLVTASPDSYCLSRAVTESAELDYEGRGMVVPYGWLSVFVMVGVNLRNSVR